MFRDLIEEVDNMLSSVRMVGSCKHRDVNSMKESNKNARHQKPCNRCEECF